MAGAAPLERIRNTAKALESSDRTLMADLHNCVVMMKLVAEDLERENRSEEVEKLGIATLELISVADHLGHHTKALESISSSYNISEGTTDFKKLLKKQAANFEKQAPSEPENHVYYKQFKEAVWNVHHAGEPMPGQECEDIVMTTSQFGIVNTTCPLSGKPVTELKEPVRSADCRHVYEREAVMAYIKRFSRRQPCKCAAAGCPRILVGSSMLCDPSLLMEIQELRVRGQVSSQAHMVADCTELDEDEA
ncbi:hypothetical protein O6H91_16G024800 [Diphasiastrum complanatum]|uniref:Uncharacterized protein n=2 Tax=Diphasiastrum complanatum TaxID=34168 RepID=A0ACC2BAV2_DIPCM|nr:hypothetical protein O6H91_16G024800 [Diphasiastrum complanatum]